MPHGFAAAGCFLTIAAWLGLPAPVRTLEQAIKVPVDAALLKCVTAYRAAVEEYKAGHTDAAFEAIAHLDRSDLRTVVAVLKTVRAGAGAPRSDMSQETNLRFAQFLWDRRVLLAAGMLHMDAAMGAVRLSRPDDFTFHTDLAASIFAAADHPQPGTNEAPGTAAERSALALGLWLMGNGRFADAGRHLAAATERFPGDPQLLLAYGTLTEALANWEGQSWRPGDLIMFSRVRAMRDAALRDAARLFERALAADPTLDEARVRLAHVRILQRDDSQAAPLLDRVLAGAPRPSADVMYLARLMLGGIRERAGQAKAAVALYLEALKERPDGQTAYIALTHAIYRAGDRESAATVIERLFGRRLNPSSDDPWWDYPMGRWKDAERMFEALRAEARQ